MHSKIRAYIEVVVKQNYVVACGVVIHHLTDFFTRRSMIGTEEYVPKCIFQCGKRHHLHYNIEQKTVNFPHKHTHI